MNILPFGDRAILAEFDSLEATMDAFRMLDRARLPGVLELVPAARTVLRLEVDSLCVHGDTLGAVAMAAAVRERLAAAGVELRAFARHRA